MNFKKLLGKAVISAALTAAVLLPSESVFAATYTVTSGDSLYKIGRLFNTSASVLQIGNNLSNNLIYPGQKLNVSCQVYTVKGGDTLFLISRNKGVSLTNLRKVNNKYNDLIYPGQILNIPANAVTFPIAGSTSSKAGVILYTESDLDLLARLITAEALSQPYNAKVSVGAVVVNRVQSSLFANNIKDVIYEKSGGYYQFTPVVNGWINKPATSDSIKAAYDALHGSDPTNGALFYFDDSATNQWLWAKPVAVRIDKMVFSY